MDKDLRELEEITFGILSEKEIKAISVCEITSPKLCTLDKNTGYGTVYDPRLGTLENTKNCETCGLGIWDCPSHWSYIQLNEPIIHPLFYKRVVDFLKCFCIKCNKLLITYDQLLINDLTKIKSSKRFDRILEKIEKIEMCSECSHPQPMIKYSTLDNNISMVYKQKDKGKISIVLPVDEIKKTFENITYDDVRMVGFNPELVHPKSLILTVFPVLPPACRPYVMADGQLCDDDLTIQIVEIIKANNHLKPDENGHISETKRQKYLQTLKFRISTFYNNSSARAKHTTNGRPIKGLKERLTGKNGQIRNNLMGKRVDQTGRTVIGPDPTLKMGQLGVPEHMAKILTVPVRVTSFNYDQLTELVNSGKVNHVITKDGIKINLQYHIFDKGTRLNHGDIIIRKDKNTGEEIEIIVNNGKDTLQPGDKLRRNGELISDLKYPGRKKYHLNIGDVCERQLQNQDILLLNRQPTLHSGSMMAQEVVIHNGKTLRFNLSIAKSYNADEK